MAHDPLNVSSNVALFFSGKKTPEGQPSVANSPVDKPKEYQVPDVIAGLTELFNSAKTAVHNSAAKGLPTENNSFACKVLDKCLATVTATQPEEHVLYGARNDLFGGKKADGLNPDTPSSSFRPGGRSEG